MCHDVGENARNKLGPLGKTSALKSRLVMPRTRRFANIPISAPFIPVAVSVTTLILMSVIIALEAIPPYCFDLKRATNLAMTSERFASISAKPRDGSFTDSNLALMDWKDCSVYAGRIFTCDSQQIETTQEAEQLQRKISQEIQACLGTSWAEAKNRSSAGFIVMHHVDQPISVTLSIDQTDQNQYAVRLILFARSN